VLFNKETDRTLLHSPTQNIKGETS